MPIPESWSSRILALLRIITGLMFFNHGLSKFFGIPPFEMPLTPLLQVGGAMELVGGALVAIGLFTRPVAFLLSGEMAVAYFLFHAPGGFMPIANHGEGAVLYCFVFLYLAAAGGGAWSVDEVRCKA